MDGTRREVEDADAGEGRGDETRRRRGVIAATANAPKHTIREPATAEELAEVKAEREKLARDKEAHMMHLKKVEEAEEIKKAELAEAELQKSELAEMIKSIVSQAVAEFTKAGPVLILLLDEIGRASCRERV